MRRNSRNWSASCAVKPGHYHLYKGANCQDAAAVVATPDITIGIGCDGCGEGEHSEMGALSIVNFALNETVQLHRANLTPDQIIEHLFPAIIRFVDMNVLLACPKSTVDVANYIKNYWLATIMGFIVTSDGRSHIFWCGDGVYAIDGQLTEIDQNNLPTYIAYNSLHNPQEVGVTSENIPRQFSHIQVDAAVTKIMVASDGFTNHNEDKLLKSQKKESGLTHNLDGQQWDKKGQFGLKKWMNSRSDRGYFDDDCFVITAEWGHHLCKK